MFLFHRSILTVPWIELGGSVQITCPQTGYRADIEFITKPFYGGKRNRITAEVYAPNEKKSFLSVNGEWSGSMEAKWNDGHKKNEVFVDVNSIPIFKKIVQPISEQIENESRRIWVDVTFGLRFNDIEKATTAKQKIEQKQREEAKQRKETNMEWVGAKFVIFITVHCISLSFSSLQSSLGNEILQTGWRCLDFHKSVVTTTLFAGQTE